MPSNQNQFNQLTLERFPKTTDKNLRAWNAADEYLLENLQELSLSEFSQVLIINDQFGALSCSLSELKPTVWTDSYLSKTAIINNLKLNQLADNTIEHVNQTCQKLKPTKTYDLVILRIPKHNSLLEYQLATIRSFISPMTKIIAAGMSKDIHKSTLRLFENHLGATTTSLAKKKARLIFSQRQSEQLCKPLESAGEWPCKWTSEYQLDSHNLIIKGLPGVFSRDNLDMGARVLLDYLPVTQGPQRLIDLGCGTGVLGTAAAQQNRELELVFCDESWLATESAKQTFISNNQADDNNTPSSIERARFLTTDCLQGLKNRHFDFVLCNPPFHQQNVQTLSIANQMFKQSAEKLKTSGELRVVANRHLKYRPLLSGYFGHVEIISKHPKFVVWLAKKPK